MKNKKRGYLLLEIMISMFLFSVIVFVVSIFLKRVVIIEKMKKNNQKSFLKPLAFIKKMRYTDISANVCVRKNVISNYKHMRCLL